MRYIKSYTQLNESTGFDILNPLLDKFSKNIDSKKLSELILPNKDILLPYYKKYVKAYKTFEKNDNINLIDPEYLVLLHEHDFEHYENIPKPKYKHPPIIFMILDDLIGDNKVFKRESLINNITIKHRHLGVNLVFTSQNRKSIPNIIRNNINIYCFNYNLKSNNLREKIKLCYKNSLREMVLRNLFLAIK